jgi:Tol biopolymer transport system component
MSTPLQENGRLDGWKAISDHLGWHVRTVMRWEQHRGLPIHRIPGGQRHAVFAFRQELDEWLKSGNLDHNDLVEDPDFPTNTVARDHPASGIPTAASEETAGLPGSGPETAHSSLWTNRLKVIWITTSFILLALVGYAIHSLAFPARLQFADVVQLTNDGALKEGLVTDGRTLYFGEHIGSKVVLASASVDGGPVRTISTPFVQAIPADISSDGRNLLVLVREGIEIERELWIVPLIGGQPKQLGTIHCHAAAWSPDGHKIAFASQNGIYLTVDEGESIRQIQSFDSTPEYLLWSRDGRRLRFELWDSKRPTFSFWELTFSDQVGTQISSLVPLHSALGDCWGGRSMTLDESGRSLFGGGECGKEKIYLLEKHQTSWNSQFELLATNSNVRHPTDLALDPRSKRVFVISDSAVPNDGVGGERLDLFRIDANAHEFRPFLPGIFATDVDFSRDGAWIAYIRRSDQTMWISHSDGTSPRRVEFPASHFELPRWSPDGKWIAFMAQHLGKPWRIFVVSADGGNPHEASEGTDNQGAPTWSPDGKWIAYGNVLCETTENCAIHKLNISTGQEFKVPGSEDLSTARWSPDGHYIAALNAVSHEISVFDLKSERWRKLFNGVNGNDLAWSADSRYVYASRPTGNQPEILRIALKDSTSETAVDLRSFAALAGRIDTWFTLAPDGSIIFLREMGSNEVYSLAYDEK